MRFDEHSIVWVVGVIDAYGDIRARETEGGIHTDEERLSGRPFRWCVCSQDFGEVRHGSERLSREDADAVIWWLEDNGYKSPGEFFNGRFGRQWLESRIRKGKLTHV